MLKKNSTDLLFFLILIFVSLGILAPISSNEIIPTIPDFANHSALIVQAKNALFSGNFPLRIAAWQFNGYQYPVFQFYSSFIYTMSAIIYALFSPNNPYLALKLMYFLGMLFAGFFIYQLGWLLSKSKNAGAIAAIAYIVSPYFLINILSRSAFTESMAQCLIPFCLYYSFKYLYNPNKSYHALIFVVLGWFMLATTHLITYLYFFIFFNLLLLGFLIFNLYPSRKIYIYWMAEIFSFFLLAWFIIPILILNNKLNIHNSIGGLYGSHWLTPISELFSFKAVSMMPLPGNGLLSSEIYPAIGWVFILSWLSSLYIKLNAHEYKPTFDIRLILILQILFALAFFITWSPVDFWRFLPRQLQVAQFSYRFLTQTMWLGSLLLIFSFSSFFKDKNIQHLFVGILMVVAISNSWIPQLKSSSISPVGIKNNPDMGYGAGEYLMITNSYLNEIKKTTAINLPISVPVQAGDGWLMMDSQIKFPRDLIFNYKNLTFNLIGTNVLEKQLILKLKFNDTLIERLIPPGPFKIQTPIERKYLKNAEIQELELSTSQFFIPKEIDNNSTDGRKISISVSDAYFSDGNVPNNNIKKASEIKPLCKKNILRDVMECNVDIISPIDYLQLPLLYYPNMLDIRVDGQKNKSYFPSSCVGMYCATVKISSGQHHISFKFSGIGWANYLSVFAWIIYFGWIIVLFNKNIIPKYKIIM